MTAPTYQDILREGSRFLEKAGVDNPQHHARILLQHCSGLDSLRFQLSRNASMPEKAYNAYLDCIKRCADHEPVAYITGKKEFFSLDFWVTPAVLIPRPETELLVEHAFHFISGICKKPYDKPICCVDACTGSGNIVISLLKELEKKGMDKLIKAYAFDISADALKVAERNKAFHQVTNLTLFRQNLFDGLALKTAGIDLLTANPPYVPYADKTHLPETVLRYEPPHALFAEDEGTGAILALVRESARVLRPGGMAIIEISSTKQAELLEKRICEKPYCEQKVFRSAVFTEDYAGIKRFLHLIRS